MLVQNFDGLLIRAGCVRVNRLVLDGLVHSFNFTVGLRVVATGSDLLNFKCLHQPLKIKTDELCAVVMDEHGLCEWIFFFYFLHEVFNRGAEHVAH